MVAIGIVVAAAGLLTAGSDPRIAAAAVAVGLLVAACVAAPSPAQTSGAALFAAVTWLVWHGPAQPTGMGLVAVVVAVGAASVPFFAWRLRDSSTIPLPHMYGLLTGAYILVGSLFARTGELTVRNITDSDRAEGLLLTSLFLVSLWAGIALGVTRSRRSPGAQPAAPVHLERYAALVVVGYLASFLLTILGLRSGLGSIPVAVDLVRIIGMLGLFGSYLQGVAPRRWLVIVVAVLVVEVFVGIGSAAIYEAARAPIAALVLYIVIRRRVPWALVVLATASALLLNTTKGEFRAETADTGASSGTEQSVGYLSNFYNQVGSTSTEDVSHAAARFSYSVSDVMGYVSANVPDRYDYWGPTTYTNLPLTVLPRVFTPWKPNFNFGNQFGRRYGLLAPNDFGTAENVPLGVEAYASFGILGLIGVGGAVGLVFAFVMRRYGDGSQVSAVVATVLTAALIQGVESDSTLVLGALPMLVIVVPPLVRWGSGKQRATAV